MRKLLIFIFLVFFSFPTYAGLGPQNPACPGGGSITNCPNLTCSDAAGVLFDDNFQNGDTNCDTDTGACENPNYEGGQVSCGDTSVCTYAALADKVADNSYLSWTFTESSTVFFKFDIQWEDVTNTYIFLDIDDSVSGNICNVYMAAGELRIYHPANPQTAISSGLGLQAATWYTVKVKVTPEVTDGVSTDGTCYVWVASGQMRTLSTDTGAAVVGLANGIGGGTDISFEPNRFIASSFTADRYILLDNIVAQTTDPDS